MEKLRQRILQAMADKLNESQLAELESELDIILYDYNISEKSTELAVLDKGNEILLKNFLGCKAIEGCSKATLKHYGESLQRMLDDVGKNVRDITTDDIRHHLALWQATRGVSNATLNNMRKAYSSFFKWCSVEKYISDNPMLRINAFKVPKKQIKPFTEREMEIMCDNATTVRDRALLEFLYSTACRVSEVASIDISDVDFVKQSVMVKNGKGAKEREVYISDKCMYHLEQYLNSRKSNDVALWVGKRGRLTKAGIEAIIRRIGERAKIHAHPHKYRHTFATDMIKRGASIQTLQKYLGHESIDTTTIYVTMDKSEIERMHRQLVA